MVNNQVASRGLPGSGRFPSPWINGAADINFDKANMISARTTNRQEALDPLISRRLSELRQVAATVQPPWGGQDLTTSAIVAEASSRPGDESEDRVTEWINRAEAGLDEARVQGGNALVQLATP